MKRRVSYGANYCTAQYGMRMTALLVCDIGPPGPQSRAPQDGIIQPEANSSVTTLHRL